MCCFACELRHAFKHGVSKPKPEGSKTSSFQISLFQLRETCRTSRPEERREGAVDADSRGCVERHEIDERRFSTRSHACLRRSWKMRKESKKILRLTQLIVLIDYAAVGAMRTVLPYYAKRLGASGTKVGGLETVYGIGQVSGSLALGWLLDARGRKVVLLLSFLGAALGYGLASVAVMQGSVTLLLLSRLPVGLAKQTVTATRAVVSDVTSPAERSESLARLFAGCSLGYAIGPYLGGLLADGMGDASPAPALICAGIFVLLLPTVAWLLPETSQPGASSSTAADGPALAAAQTASGSAADSAAASSPKATPWLLLVGVTLPEAALIMLSSTALPLLSQRIGWSATQLGEFSSAWGSARARSRSRSGRFCSRPMPPPGRAAACPIARRSGWELARSPSPAEPSRCGPRLSRCGAHSRWRRWPLA